MSDAAPTTPVAPATAAPAAAPEAAAPAQAPAAPSIDTTQPPALVKEAARGAMHQRLEARRAAEHAERAANPVGETATPSAPSPTDPTPASVDARGRGHAADGKYTEGVHTPPETPAADAPPDPTSAAAPDGSQPETTAEAPAAKPQDALVRIPVPEGHPLRDQGITEIPTTPEAERATRALLNGYTRTEAVRTAETRERQATQVAAEWQAYAEGLQEQMQAFIANPEIAIRAAEIEQAYGAEERDRYLAGVFAEGAQKVGEKVDGVRQQYAQQAQEQAAAERGMQFLDSTYGELVGRFQKAGMPVAPSLESVFQHAAEQYHARLRSDIDAGRPATLDPEALIQIALFEYSGDPAVKAWWSAQQAASAAEAQRQAEAKAAQELAARNQRTLEEAAAARKNLNPIAQVAPAVGAAGAPPVEPAPDLTSMTPGDIQRMSRDRARQRLATRV